MGDAAGEPRLANDRGWLSNTWQGPFPQSNTAADGFVATAPVGSYPASTLGLYDLLGNVWELTRTAYSPDLANGGQPDIGTESLGFDPRQPEVSVVVLKGGSFLCSPDACRRYRPSARHPQDRLMATNHIGFRTVREK